MSKLWTLDSTTREAWRERGLTLTPVTLANRKVRVETGDGTAREERQDLPGMRALVDAEKLAAHYGARRVDVVLSCGTSVNAKLDGLAVNKLVRGAATAEKAQRIFLNLLDNWLEAGASPVATGSTLTDGPDGGAYDLDDEADRMRGAANALAYYVDMGVPAETARKLVGTWLTRHGYGADVEVLTA